MPKFTKYGLREFKRQFPNESACLEHLFDSLHSYQCSCGGKYALIRGRKQFQCSKCRYQIAPMAGTIFEKSTTPLTLWFFAIFIFSNAKSGISAKEMERQLNVTYKTAWRMLKLIRKSLKQKRTLLKGNVEMDEGFFRGSKIKVLAAVERGGQIRAKKVGAINLKNIDHFLRYNIEPTKSFLMTDASPRYNNVARWYDRYSVNHSKKEFVRGSIHTNTVDAFWSHLKRSMTGTYKSVSKQHFQSYLDQFVFLRNNRHNDRKRFGVLLGMVLQKSRA